MLILVVPCESEWVELWNNLVVSTASTDDFKKFINCYSVCMQLVFLYFLSVDRV